MILSTEAASRRPSFNVIALEIDNQLSEFSSRMLGGTKIMDKFLGLSTRIPSIIQHSTVRTLPPIQLTSNISCSHQ
jgi:hypothetical protein